MMHVINRPRNVHSVSVAGREGPKVHFYQRLRGLMVMAGTSGQSLIPEQIANSNKYSLSE